MTLYRLLDRLGLRRCLRALLRPELAGAENVPSHGPAILVANHESVLDAFVLVLLTGRPVRFMAKAELWRYPVVRQTLDALGTFPVARGAGDLEALRHGVELLERGEVVGVFPQGTSRQDPVRRFHRGAARLALATGAPLVPVRLCGTRRLPRPGRPGVSIRAFPPIEVERGPATIAAARALTERLEQVIARAR